MTVIPAQKDFAAKSVATHLSDILFWAEEPDEKFGYSCKTWEAHKERFSSVISCCIRSFGDEPNVVNFLANTQSMTFAFMGKMFRHPELSTIEVMTWPDSEKYEYKDLKARVSTLLQLSEGRPFEQSTITDVDGNSLDNRVGTRRQSISQTDCTEESRPPIEWAAIFDVSTTTFHNRVNGRKGSFLPHIRDCKECYYIHKDHLPTGMKSKANRDARIAEANLPGRKNRAKKNQE